MERRIRVLSLDILPHGYSANDVESQVCSVLVQWECLARGDEMIDYVQVNSGLLDDDGQEGHEVLGCEAWIKPLANRLPLLILGAH